MKKSLITIFAIVLSLSALAQEHAKITFSDGVFDENTSWSLCIADAVTGEIISDKDAMLNLIPASIAKLIPTAAALTLLGEEYRFTTSLAFTGELNTNNGQLDGDIIIIGGGDPMLGSPYFSDSYGDVTGKWADAISGAGIKNITGNIVSDASVYDYQPVPGGWEWEDLGTDYGPGIHGINFNDNTFNIFLSCSREASKPAIDSINSFARNLTITNSLISNNKSVASNVYSAPYGTSVELAGTIPAHNITITAALPDPPLAIASLLKSRLISEGINVGGLADTRRVSISNDSVMEMLSATISPSLKEMITVTNHESVNLYAAQLCKHLGLVFRNDGSYEAGMNVLNAFLETIGCNSKEIIFNDPTGLSRKNTINAASLVKLLTYLYNSPNRDTFIATLPEAGVSGTLKNTFKNEIFKNRLFAKTGSMSGVKSIAGYVTTVSGKVMAFTIIVNSYTTTNEEVQAKMENIIKEIILNY